MLRAGDLFHEILNTNMNPHINITGLTTDSRRVQDGYIFVALSSEGEKFAQNAINAGACLVISQCNIEGINNIHVSKNVHLIYSKLCARFYGNNQPPYVVAVTGTNGKTSTTDFYRQIWGLSGKKSACIGTCGVIEGNPQTELKYPVLTTPDAFDMHKLLKALSEKKIEFLALEASSHGIEQCRVHSVSLCAAAFTNISHDHLSYHNTMENYLNAKKRLFSEILPQQKTAVLNKDSSAFAEIFSASKNQNHKVITFGKNADLSCIKQKLVPAGQELSLSIFGTIHNLFFPVLGDFQAQNLLCAIGLAIGSNYKLKPDLCNIIETMTAPIGRMMLINDIAIVDYAHTPDALLKALNSVKAHYPGKNIISVFGCGGNRDRLKRPIMGKISFENSFATIITDDNFRDEDPATIRSEILAECPNGTEIADREQAIKYGIDFAKKNNGIVLIAGKGHEGYSVHGSNVFEFSDRDIALNYI